MMRCGGGKGQAEAASVLGLQLIMTTISVSCPSQVPLGCDLLTAPSTTPLLKRRL